jgi:hypothetical protein
VGKEKRTPKELSDTNNSWMYQALMDINKGIGSLQSDVKHLSEKIDSEGKKISILEGKMGNLEGWVKYGLGAFAVIALIFTFIPSSKKEAISSWLFSIPSEKLPQK